MKISIVTPWLNQPQLIPAYEAAVAGAEVIVVDQASDTETAAALDAMCERLGNGSRVIHSVVNLRFAAGNNAGLAVATGEIVCFLNNDVYGDHRRPNHWLTFVERDTPARALSGPSIQSFPVDREPVPYLEGWCLAASRETWQLLGGWDATIYPQAYAEDVDTSWRARILGCELRLARWPIHHIGNVTNDAVPDGYTYADQQRALFTERYRAWKRGELRLGQSGNGAATAPDGNGAMPLESVPEYA